MTWEIFLGIAALAAFLAGVITPIVKLTNTITKLSGSVDRLDLSIQDLKSGQEKLEKRLHELEVSKR